MTGDKALRGVDPVRLEPWLAARLPDAQPPFRYTLIAGGHSNLTFQVSDAAGQCWVLRRPPIGASGVGAHDMAREHRIQRALAGSDVPIAPMVTLCTDPAVNDSPFYIMDFVDGVVVDRPSRVLATLPGRAERTVAANSLVDALAAMHRTDLQQVGLADLGRSADYVARQLRRMRKVWDETKTRELPRIESVGEALSRFIPAETRTSLLHCDFRLGNVMLDRLSHKVSAVLDWELAALGDPRVDLAFLLCSWDQPDDPSPGVWMEEAPTRAGGFPSRDELVARYAANSGMGEAAVQDIDYFCGLAYWRIAIIAEGIKRRYMSGAMGKDADMDAIERRIHARAEFAAHYLDRAQRQRAV